MSKLPPGQQESEIFPRFGLPQYANRFPREVDRIHLSVGGEIDAFEVPEEVLRSLPRVSQVSDFHCVTTWSKLRLPWSGYRFSDFYEALVAPHATDDITTVVLRAQDGYKTSLPLADLLRGNVLLADRLDDRPLPVEHGAPVRIVAPDHYGYKNVKHLDRLEFYTEEPTLKHGLLKFMDHPRARVAREERAQKLPGRMLRWLYSLGISKTIEDFRKATANYYAERPTSTRK